MKPIETIMDMRTIVHDWKKSGMTVGLVPTMGFLHAGHLSLIERAKEQNDRVVVSIFVNPTQFGEGEDFSKYPRDLEGDLQSCENAGAHAVFAPSVSEMYPMPSRSYVDILELSDHLCGAKRSGHFRGVCTVVTKLFNIVAPDKAYFGEKDAQQLAIIRRMAYDLNIPVQIIPCHIVRDQDGLALSSRNAYLSSDQKQAALILSKSLAAAKALMMNGQTDAGFVRRSIHNAIECEPLARIDYVELVDADTLKPLERIQGPVLLAVAVYFGNTRLIDNFTFDPAQQHA